MNIKNIKLLLLIGLNVNQYEASGFCQNLITTEEFLVISTVLLTISTTAFLFNLKTKRAEEEKRRITDNNDCFNFLIDWIEEKIDNIKNTYYSICDILTNKETIDIDNIYTTSIYIDRSNFIKYYKDTIIDLIREIYKNDDIKIELKIKAINTQVNNVLNTLGNIHQETIDTLNSIIQDVNTTKEKEETNFISEFTNLTRRKCSYIINTQDSQIFSILSDLRSSLRNQLNDLQKEKEKLIETTKTTYSSINSTNNI